MLGLLIGKITAIVFIVRFYNAGWNLYDPNYQDESMNTNVRWILSMLGLYRLLPEFYWNIIYSYTGVVVMGVIITLNVRSFVRNLLVSLKNVLREA